MNIHSYPLHIAALPDPNAHSWHSLLDTANSSSHMCAGRAGAVAAPACQRVVVASPVFAITHATLVHQAIDHQESHHGC
jgi:hypothetical protein